MGLAGGFIGFAIGVIAYGVIGLALLPHLSTIGFLLMLAFSASVIGVMLARAIAPALGVLLSTGIVLSSLAALVLAGVIGTLVMASWNPLAPVVAASAVLSVLSPSTGALILISALLALVGLIGALFVQFLLTTIAYIVAALASLGAQPSAFEAEARGACVGVNAAANLLIGIAIIPAYLILALGWVTGGFLGAAALGGIFIASIIPFRRNRAGLIAPDERTAIAWLVCLLPTAWLMELLGLALFLTSLVCHAFFGFLGAVPRLTNLRLRPDTGSVVVTGGLAANLNPAPMFNIGTFTFVRTITPALIQLYDDASFVGFEASVLNHEIGHQLNLAAFGTAFNIVGFIDEWFEPLLFGNSNVYGERLASTNDPSPNPKFSTNLNMWVI